MQMAQRIGLLVILFISLAVQAQQQTSIEYTYLASSVPKTNTHPDTILHYFSLADAYMEIDRYDSAEYWLSKVGDRLEFKSPNIFNYYYHSRQAEVFYYNDLLQLGLQQTNRALQIALKLNDSIFIADAYNFLGLFSLNLDKYKEAEIYLKQGLLYARKDRTDPLYLSLSEVHHLHGNLGEAYVKLNKYDIALKHFDSSIRAASVLNAKRAKALGYISAGEALYALEKYDSALHCNILGRNLALESRDYDVALLGFGNLATSYAKQGDIDLAYAVADSGKALLADNPGLNPFYTLLFLRRLVKMFEGLKDHEKIAAELQEILSLEEFVKKRSNLQIEEVLSAGLKNENRLLQMEVLEAREKQSRGNFRIILLLMIIALMILAGLYYRNGLKQKLALASIREKISQNLHDDMGATISSLYIYSEIAQNTIENKPATALDMIKRISEQSKLLMEDMSDMVWSMKGQGQEIMKLDARIKNYGVELLNARNISCKYQIDESAFDGLSQFDARKNVLLMIKEAINNIAKYSMATEAVVEVFRKNNKLHIHIADNGMGFDLNNTTNGNGLKNMSSRVKELGGQLKIETQPGAGTSLTAILPF
jgi:signal transduction histidine kinase